MFSVDKGFISDQLLNEISEQVRREVTFMMLVVSVVPEIVKMVLVSQY